MNSSFNSMTLLASSLSERIWSLEEEEEEPPFLDVDGFSPLLFLPFLWKEMYRNNHVIVFFRQYRGINNEATKEIIITKSGKCSFYPEMLSEYRAYISH